MSALVPELGSEIPRRGSAVMRAFGRVLLRLMRFRVDGAMPNLPKFVVAVAPHTSNWDFVIGAAAMFALDLRIAFLGKHTLFVGPFGPVMRWMGGVPVDRSSPHGVVGDAVAAFACVDRRILAIAPQGTRSPVPHFRTGFLQIARGAGVPVMLAAFDWEARIIRFGPAFEIGEDIDAERARIEAHFAPIRGKHPR